MTLTKYKAMKKSSLNLPYNGDNSYLFVNGKEIYKFKPNNNFSTQFCLGKISNKFGAIDSREVL